MTRIRLDVLLADRGLYSSRTAAAAAVRAGAVQLGADGPIADKPGQVVEESAEIVVREREPYVSRGGRKLEAALEAFGVEPAGKVFIDVGASTGGFTDCLLERGAEHVIAVDVGSGQLDWRLRNDERVTVMEGVNARELGPGSLPAVPELATIDVSFISLTLILGPVLSVLAPGGEILAMVKPQFELGPDRVGKGGVVRDPEDRRDALRRVSARAAELGAPALDACPSGLPGPKGNRESFLRLVPGAEAPDPEAVILRAEP
jgi:23S rRNA (cytidine1920-2'-O)/16S rRNA (cytidine1409-2'-O)-methyltransferase